ncbi:GroES-like protein [Karstenula rhodostoma CBS 690.94]|uniref:GroES-like protein n=1 Tax=Karstenula rhodostoma CBS 690.94 TaxID=1392251 RepID=A0A9P4PXL4_9PLEO|nr:GroES-like protein [Karstenula rhodostoma CBS 690.94]
MANQTKNLAAVLPAAQADFVVEERPIPTPGPNEVLVRNHFIGLNPLDWKRQLTGMFIPSYPAVLGTDLSGVVEAVGSNVSKFKPGDRVLGGADGIVSQKPENAAFQTYTILRSSSTSKLPSSVSLEQAATLTTSIVTSYLMLFHVLGLPKPELKAPPPNATVLVWGGASMTGNLTIQLAKLAGLNVYATASKKNHEHLRSLGASVLFDYNSSTVVEDAVAAAEREGKPIAYVADTIASTATLSSVQDILSKSTATAKVIAHTGPWPEDLPKLDAIDADMVHGEELWYKPDMIQLGSKIFHEDLPTWLESGVIAPPPYRVIEGGVGKIQAALEVLKAGVSNQKVLVAV